MYRRRLRRFISFGPPKPNSHTESSTKMGMSKDVCKKLLDLSLTTGYPITQRNGQRRFGPKEGVSPPPKGCEVFVGRLPRDVFEDELVPLFSSVGTIYELRLMMDFSGSNRGYAFVTYSKVEEANAAILELNRYQMRPGYNIGVVISVDNCRLFLGGIPQTKSKEEVLQEMNKHVDGVVDVILYKNCFNRSLNRGFAFVEFKCHRAAAMARRKMIPGYHRLWDQDVQVDWAEPEPYVDNIEMQKVKVLYFRNLSVNTSTATLKKMIEEAAQCSVLRVKKINDYAFVHFSKRQHAEVAMALLQDKKVDNLNMEIHWAKPVNRELYKMQKMLRGNSKFNRLSDMEQTLLLYKKQAKQIENSVSLSDEGIESRGNSECSNESYANKSSSVLESFCKRYNWAPPMYTYMKYDDINGMKIWTCKLEIPMVGPPLLKQVHTFAPIYSYPCFTKDAAQENAVQGLFRAIQAIQQKYSASLYQELRMLPHIQGPSIYPHQNMAMMSAHVPLPMPAQTVLPPIHVPHMMSPIQEDQWYYNQPIYTELPPLM